jgi:hypothetical protein
LSTKKVSNYDNEEEQEEEQEQEQEFGNNSYAQLFNGNEDIGKTFYSLLFFFDIENTTISRIENTDPIPNPWARRGIDAAATPPLETQQPTSSTNIQPQQQQQAAPIISIDISNSLPSLISSMMQNYMLQLVQISYLLEHVFNALYIQPLMDSLGANPDISRQMLANNPKLFEQMVNALPTMMEQMRNPEIQTLIQNQEALNAITQVQEG